MNRGKWRSGGKRNRLSNLLNTVIVAALSSHRAHGYEFGERAPLVNGHPRPAAGIGIYGPELAMLVNFDDRDGPRQS